MKKEIFLCMIGQYISLSQHFGKPIPIFSVLALRYAVYLMPLIKIHTLD